MDADQLCNINKKKKRKYFKIDVSEQIVVVELIGEHAMDIGRYDHAGQIVN